MLIAKVCARVYTKVDLRAQTLGGGGCVVDSAWTSEVCERMDENADKFTEGQRKRSDNSKPENDNCGSRRIPLNVAPASGDK